MSSFAPTLIAPAPCRPIPLVRNRHHQHHQSRYARLSGGSSISSAAGITTPPIAALPSAAVRSMSPHYHPFSTCAASASPPLSGLSGAAAAVAAASAASAFVFPQRPAPPPPPPAAAASDNSGRRSASGGRHSRPGSLTLAEDNKRDPAHSHPTSPPPSSGSALSPVSETPSEDSLRAEVYIDHDLTPTRKNMQSFSASITQEQLADASTQPDSTPVSASAAPGGAVGESAKHRRGSSTFLEVPPSAASLLAITQSSPDLYSTAFSSPALSDHGIFSPVSAQLRSASSSSSSSPSPAVAASGSLAVVGGLSMSPDPSMLPGAAVAPLHPSLIPPSPIPRRLTRNPFARAVSQGYGLGIGHPGSPAARSESNLGSYANGHSSGELAFDEPAPRFSLDTIGIGLMEIDFDLDAVSADDGGRELLRVERERRKKSFEMHS